MKRGVVLACALASLAFGASTSEAAAIRKWSVEAGVAGGYNKVDADAELQDSSISGIRVGLAIAPSFSVEAFIDSTSTESAQQVFAGSDFSQDSIGLRLIGTFRSTEDVKAMPYIVAGGGQIKTDFDPGTGAALESDEASFGEIGGGVRYFVWKGFSVRGEFAIRQYRTLDVTHADSLFTVGLSWMLGGKK